MGQKTRGDETMTLLVEFNRYEGETFESKYRLRWDVPYRAGPIKVVGYRNGEVVCEKEIRTAGDPARVRLRPDRESIQADGYDLSFVTVRIEDESGTLCPIADNLVRFELEGPGEIAPVGNGNAATTEPFQADYRRKE
jgi:beta-galactosidase